MSYQLTGPPRQTVFELCLQLESYSKLPDHRLSSLHANILLQLFQMARDDNVAAFQALQKLADVQDDKIARGYVAVLLTSDKISTIDQDIDRAKAMMLSLVIWLSGVCDEFQESVDSISDLSRHTQFLLGFCYSEGYGVAQSLENAVHLLSLSADKGHPAAQNSLALACFKGLGMAKDYGMGAYYYLESADQNNTVGQYNCGVCHIYGTGVNQNDDEALRRFRQAAAKGHVRAKIAAKELMLGQQKSWLEERYDRIYKKRENQYLAAESKRA